MSYYARARKRPERRKPKPHNLTKHAIDRGRRRFGMSYSVVVELEKLITRGSAAVLRSLVQQNGRVLHEVLFLGNNYFVIYSKADKHLVTFLPLARGRELFGEEQTPRCICGRMLALVGDRRICTGGCEQVSA